MSNRLMTLLGLLALIGVGMAVMAFFPQGEKPIETPSEYYALPPATAPVLAEKQMVVTANPYASQAGLDVLRAGGTAADAAVAVLATLTLVEPQSSGLGGGAFMLYYDATARTLSAYDGRETAPRAATPDRFMDGARRMDFFKAVLSGRSVGVPGAVAMLEMAHKAHGKLEWADLFKTPTDLAFEGFIMSPRLNKMLLRDPVLGNTPDAQNIYFRTDSVPVRQGDPVFNPDYGETLKVIAESGAAGFYRGPLAQAMVGKINISANAPGDMTLADFATYQAKQRVPLCLPYRNVTLCGMPPPTSGGLLVLQTLKILENLGIENTNSGSAQAVHLISEASRLAYADRAKYVGDPDFIDVPVSGLLDANYLHKRAALVDPRKVDLQERRAGTPPMAPAAGADATIERGGTSHFSIVDQWGNVVSLTASIEGPFGAHIISGGMFLNNELTDFSFTPRDPQGNLIANRVEGGKRPRSSMSPTIVFDEHGKFLLAIGSPGGSRIPAYVLQSLIGVIDWDMDVQAAISMPRHVNRNGKTELEQGTPLAEQADTLRGMGHRVAVQEITSGLHGIMRLPNGKLAGGADPRREGRALGD
ncbi:MAG: gamma-glutamyltransferase [Alphaproteobacteria bacterium]